MTPNTQISVTLTQELRLAQALKQAGVKNPAKIKQLTIAGNLTKDDFAYIRQSMAKTLQELDISATSVTVIKWGTFSGCVCLTSITIPASVAKIEEYVFIDCDSLISINVSNSIPDINMHPLIAKNKILRYLAARLNLRIKPAFTSENGVLFNREKTVLISYPMGREGH